MRTFPNLGFSGCPVLFTDNPWCLRTKWSVVLSASTWEFSWGKHVLSALVMEFHCKNQIYLFRGDYLWENYGVWTKQGLWGDSETLSPSVSGLSQGGGALVRKTTDQGLQSLSAPLLSLPYRAANSTNSWSCREGEIAHHHLLGFTSGSFHLGILTK